MKESLNRDDAQAKCVEADPRANLASLDTPAKQKLVQTMMPEDRSVWIGAQCVGCKIVTEDNWQWLSGKKLLLNDPLWWVEGGKQTPWDNSENDAINLVYICKNGECKFINWNSS